MSTNDLERLVTASVSAEPEYFLGEAARLLDAEPINDTEPETLVPYVAAIIKMGIEKGIGITCQAMRDNGITLNQRGM